MPLGWSKGERFTTKLKDGAEAMQAKHMTDKFRISYWACSLCGKDPKNLARIDELKRVYRAQDPRNQVNFIQNKHPKGLIQKVKQN